MPAIEQPGRFFIRMAEDHLGVVALRSPAEMVRDAILAAVFHRFLPRQCPQRCIGFYDVILGRAGSSRTSPTPPPSAPDQPPPPWPSRPCQFGARLFQFRFQAQA